MYKNNQSIKRKKSSREDALALPAAGVAAALSFKVGAAAAMLLAERGRGRAAEAGNKKKKHQNVRGMNT